MLIPVAFILLLTYPACAQSSDRPNVLLIITDDQGYGDLGFTGNPHVRTPTLDQLAQESIRLTDFYVSPVCASTRASLMTGRYSLRTGVHDTYNGGAIMAPTEVTLAEMLRQANYTTGVEPTGQDKVVMEDVYLPRMKGDLRPFYQTEERRVFPFWVKIERK